MTHIELRDFVKKRKKVCRTVDGEASDCGFAHTIFAAVWKQLKRATKRGEVPPKSVMDALRQLCSEKFTDQNGVESMTPHDIRQRAIETVRTLLLSGGLAVSMRQRVMRRRRA